MDSILKTKIHNKLAQFLNREPSEDEIINAQSDSRLMGWIFNDDLARQKTDLQTIKVNNKLK